MRLRELINNLGIEINSKFLSLEISGISSDSRQIRKGYLFVAIEGQHQDGHNFISEALRRGARVVVYKQGNNLRNCLRPDTACFIAVRNTRVFLSVIASRFFGEPSGELKVIGITGTNGKTTVSYLIESILAAAGKSTGVIGTIDYRFMGYRLEPKNTTPPPVEIQGLLAKMREEKIDYVIIEVSSHSLHQERVRNIDFKTAVFTNLSYEHLDYHQDLEDYFSAKQRLFLNRNRRPIAIINRDDPYGLRLIDRIGEPLITYGINSKSDILAENINLNLDGSQFLVKMSNSSLRINTHLLGIYNIYNILASIGACFSLGIDLDFIKTGIDKLEFVPDRLQPIQCGQKYQIFVDYAHTDDALKNILATLNNIQDQADKAARLIDKKARLILVFGCGGRRDRSKRKKMGSVASALSDFCIITNDNPRDEHPQDIANEIVEGLNNNRFEVILDRFQAITRALNLASPGDIVVIAGKGHENYQIFKHKTIPFNDIQVVKQILLHKKTNR